MIDLTGKRFGLLFVTERTNKRTKCRHVVYQCICDCGKETFVSSNSLRSDGTMSCGCLGIKNAIKHGNAINNIRTGEYYTWSGMIQRCTNSNNPRFKDYGGRGVKVCKEWLHSFKNFLAYLKDNNMYPRPAEMSIDRIDNDGNYEPGNIRWATALQQKHNQRKQ